MERGFLKYSTFEHLFNFSALRFFLNAALQKGGLFKKDKSVPGLSLMSKSGPFATVVVAINSCSSFLKRVHNFSESACPSPKCDRSGPAILASISSEVTSAISFNEAGGTSAVTRPENATKLSPTGSEECPPPDFQVHHHSQPATNERFPQQDSRRQRCHILHRHSSEQSIPQGERYPPLTDSREWGSVCGLCAAVRRDEVMSTGSALNSERLHQIESAAVSIIHLRGPATVCTELALGVAFQGRGRGVSCRRLRRPRKSPKLWPPLQNQYPPFRTKIDGMQHVLLTVAT
jgi:hypothetical protein